MSSWHPPALLLAVTATIAWGCATSPDPDDRVSDLRAEVSDLRAEASDPSAEASDPEAKVWKARWLCVASTVEERACQALGDGCVLTFPPGAHPCENVGARCTQEFATAALQKRAYPCLCTCSEAYRAARARMLEERARACGGAPCPPPP